MDNLGSHKGKAVRAAIRAAGAKLFFLPKYSPDLNPIEQVFAKLKHLLRKAAARTVETVTAAVGQLLGSLHPAGMRQLLQQRRIRASLKSSRSSELWLCARRGHDWTEEPSSVTVGRSGPPTATARIDGPQFRQRPKA